MAHFNSGAEGGDLRQSNASFNGQATASMLANILNASDEHKHQRPVVPKAVIKQQQIRVPLKEPKGSLRTHLLS